MHAYQILQSEAGRRERGSHGNVMVDDEEHPEDNSKWKRERDPLPVELSKPHDPGAVTGKVWAGTVTEQGTPMCGHRGTCAVAEDPCDGASGIR